MARILAIGGAHLDRRGRITGETVPVASNPGEWREEAGGGVFNAARALSRFGHRVRLVAPRGGDAAGEIVGDAAVAAGIEDTPLTFLDRRTASYTAILTSDGDLFIALADMAIYDVYGPRQIARRSIREAVAASDAVITDANLPAPTIAALAAACGKAGKPLFGIAKTLEVLESLGVPVVTCGSHRFPAFWSRDSGLPSPLSLADAPAIAWFQAARTALGIAGGMLVANPVPEAAEIARTEMEGYISAALAEAERRNVGGKAVTPFLLSEIFRLTGGRSQATNIALVRSNAGLAAEIAVALGRQ